MSHPYPSSPSPASPATPGGAGAPAPAAGPGTPGVPAAAPTGPRERRVRLGHLALAISLVVVGALGTTALVVMVAAEGEYLALARDVDYGSRITESDVVTVQMGNPQAVRPVAADRRGEVVGAYAAMPLAAGTLLTDVHYTDTPHPQQGEVRLGVPLRTDRLPADPVRPGQVVLLVETGSGDAGPGTTGADDEPARPARTWQATVVRVGSDGTGSGLLGGGAGRTVTVDVIVPAPEAPVVADLAAAGRLSVAVLPGQPER